MLFHKVRMIKEELLKYYVINKPFQALSQFTNEDDKKCLKDYFKVPNDVYPVGRLDYDSEGLLILTNDNHLKNHILSPKSKTQKVYYVQVENVPKRDNLNTLENGVVLNIKGKDYKTAKCKVNFLPKELEMPERNPPIRFRQSIPTKWLEFYISEGKNRQIRKMTAKINCPTLRIVRYAIGAVNLDLLAGKSILELKRAEIYALIGLDKDSTKSIKTKKDAKKKFDNQIYHKRLEVMKGKTRRNMESTVDKNTNNPNSVNSEDTTTNKDLNTEKKVDAKAKPIVKPALKPVNPFINGGGFGNKKGNSLPKNNMRARRR